MIISFLKVLFFESLQNIFSIIPVILAARNWKNSKKGIAILYAACGSILSYLCIALTETMLLKLTTLPPDNGMEGNILLNLFAGSVMFAVFAILFTIYINQKWSSKKTDIVVGAFIAICLSLLQTKSLGQDSSIVRFKSHTLAFIVSFPVTIILIRDAIVIESIKKAMVKGVVANLIMSVIIVIVDYGAFLI